MESITTRPIDKVIKGIVYRGQKSVLRIDSNNFLCEGSYFYLVRFLLSSLDYMAR